MLEFKKFQVEDIKVLMKIMYDAFNEDSRIHGQGAKNGPEGYDNGDFFRKWFLHPKATAFTIYLDGIAIGGVNLWINENTNKNFLGCIFIDPKYENQGIGTKVWFMIEKMFPNTKVWGTETPIYSHRNHNFYINKCGFSCIKIENPKKSNEGFFVLQKVMN